MNRPLRLIIVILAGLAIIGVFALPLPGFVNLTTKIVTVTSIKRPNLVVFDYVTTPVHWPNWHPSSLSVRGATDHSLSAGEQVTEEFRVAGRRGRVVWTVAMRDRPRTWVITGTIDGKPAGAVSYALTPVGVETRFERAFEYRAPSLWFAALNFLVLRARIQQESDDAVARLKQVLEAMPQTGLHGASVAPGPTNPYPRRDYLRLQYVDTKPVRRVSLTARVIQDIDDYPTESLKLSGGKHLTLCHCPKARYQCQPVDCKA